MPTTVKVCDAIYNIPFVEELTIKDLIGLRHLDRDKPLEVLKWAFGVEPALVDSKLTERQLTNVFRLIDNLIADTVNWMNSDERVAIPKTIEMLGLTIKFKPGLVNELPYWGTVRCKQAMKEEIQKQGEHTDFTDRIPEILAHYFYSLVTRNGYNEDKAEDFIKVVESLNMRDAIQAGNFFLLKHLPYFQSKKNSWLTKLTVRNKRLGLKISRFLGISTTLKH